MNNAALWIVGLVIVSIAAWCLMNNQQMQGAVATLPAPFGNSVVRFTPQTSKN